MFLGVEKAWGDLGGKDCNKIWEHNHLRMLKQAIEMKRALLNLLDGSAFSDFK